ncbi:MAG: hypothetical protein EON59_10730 [Alphaproteobacteria bacterium]|nr:MAG: hypothetical protein EON59_10730 [Alphaproteobacteria bacterium]
MKTVVMAGLVAFGMLTVPALAAAPSAEQKAEFYKTCMGIAQNEPLCTCKADEAVKVADDEMLGFIITAMKDNAKFREMVQKGEVPEAVVKKWPVYVRESNKVCLPPAN